MNLTTPLPQSHDSECRVISSALDDQRRYYEMAGIISASDFCTPHLATAWKQITRLCETNQRPTLFRIRETFGDSPDFQALRDSLTGLSGVIPAHAVEYARSMADRSCLRRIALAVDLLQNRVTTAETADDARQAIESVFVDTCSIATASKGFRRADVIVADIEKRAENPVLAPRYPTGFRKLDRMLKEGLKEKQFVVIGGRTGGGKTVLAMNFAVQFALKGIPVAVFSLEMDDVDLLTRCIFSETQVRSQEDALEAVRNLPLYVDDTSNVTLKSIAARVKMMIMRHNVKVCVVDYLQLIGTDGQERDSRERIVAGMSRLLKVTAKETGCCIIALSQLNEAGELRESRAIEQDADVVLYVIDNEHGDVFLRVTKQRGGESHGPMKRLKDDDPGIPLRWHKENFRFSEL